MEVVHVPPPTPVDIPCIVLFHDAPHPTPSPVCARLKGFNLGLCIRCADERYDLLVKNRNTDDTLFLPMTQDTAQEMGRYSPPSGRGWNLVLIDGKDLRVTFLPRYESPLDPTGETDRMLERIRHGHLQEAMARWQRGSLPDAALSDVWLELALFHGSALTQVEFAMARQHVQRGLQSHPDHWRLLSAMGTIRRHEGRDEEALGFFSRSHEAFPYDVNNLVSYVSTLLASADEVNVQRIRHLGGLAYDLNPRSTGVTIMLRNLEEAGIASRTYFRVCPLDSRLQV
jgi:tetratricopeptide (TPR) repeat protein